MTLEGRRAFLGRIARLARLPLVAGGAFGYGSLLERHQVGVERHAVELPLGEGGPSKLRAVVMGDFHFDPLFEADYIARCVALANSLQPDLVFLTGDYMTRRSERAGEFASLLSGLRPRGGVFGCLGNHDHWAGSSRVAAALRSGGVEVLVNQRTRVSCGGGTIEVAGLQSAWAGRPDWPEAARGLRSGGRAIVLAHEPDFARALGNDPRPVLQLSGHTHGGQVRLPFVGALRLPAFGRLFQAGFYDVGSLKLHVNRGIGTVGIHVRFFCPPEITCLDITNRGDRSA